MSTLARRIGGSRKGGEYWEVNWHWLPLHPSSPPPLTSYALMSATITCRMLSGGCARSRRTADT